MYTNMLGRGCLQSRAAALTFASLSHMRWRWLDSHAARGGDSLAARVAVARLARFTRWMAVVAVARLACCALSGGAADASHSFIY